MITTSAQTTNGLTDAELRATPVDVADGGGSLTVDATNLDIRDLANATDSVTAHQGGTWTVTGSGGTFPVTDSGGSLTVDAPVGTPVFVRLSDGASAISTLPVSFPSGVTVTGTDAHDAAVTAKPVLIGGFASTSAPTAVSADGDAVQLWVSRTGVLQVGDGGGSLTVDAPVGTPLFTRLSDGAGALDTRVMNIDAQAIGVNGFLSTIGFMHGYNGSSWDRVRTVNTGQVKSTLYDAAGSAQLPSAAALVDGVGNPTTPIVGSAGLLFNGTTWDRKPGLIESTLLTSGTRNATTGTSTQVNRGCTGVMIILRVSVASGTGGLGVWIFGIDPTSGVAFQINAVPTYVTTTGIFVYEVCPGTSGTSPTVMQRTAGRLPRGFTVTIVHNDSSNYTYSLGQVLLP
jgi:hypothetical protein